MPDRSEILDPRLLEVWQVGRVVDDPHGVGLGEARAQPVRERIVSRVPRRLQRLARHRSLLLPVGTTPVPSASGRAPTPDSARRPRPSSDDRRRLGAIRFTNSWLKMANSPSASTVTMPSCTMRPLLKTATVRHLGDPPLEDGLLVNQGGPQVAQGEAHRRPVAPAIAFAAVRMMSNVAARTAPCTQPGAPS